MIDNQFFRDLLVGKERIDSRTEYKESRLRGQFGLLIGGICFAYIFIDIFSGVTTFIPFYLFGIFASGLIITLNRTRRSTGASITILIFSNLLVFVFSTIDSPFSGVFLYFTGTAAAAIILFARHHRYIGHIFVLISIALGLLAHTTEWSPIPNPPANDAYVQVSFITNYTIGILACVLIVHFSISRNNEAEASLMASIKAREQAEQTLILKNEELEKANKELDRFVYSASHDMRAPLSSLLGLMEIIRLTNKNSELNEYLGLMKKRILTMEGFIKEITDYSRNTRMTVSAEKVNFYNLVKGVIESIEFVAPRDAVEARVNIPEDMMVECDVARMKVILNNLISNCLKYQDSDKEARYYSISAKMKEDELTMVVEDNGIGIEENYQEKVFDMFFRATELSDGSGLGLYIVKETVEKLKGEIQVASTPGVGSTFTVTIPLLIESPA